MIIYKKYSIRLILVGTGLIILSYIIGCASLNNFNSAFEKPFTYYEFDGVFVYYKTQDLSTYRELLPKTFEMPEQPLVMIFVMDYYKMDKATQPYKEAAVFLLAKYKQKEGWHCVTMPVTSNEARIGGVTFLGYPKIMGDVEFERGESNYAGMLMLNNKTIMTVKLESRKDNKVSQPEEELFYKLSKFTGFNLLNGVVYEPEFGKKTNLMEISRLYPQYFTLNLGTANLTQDSKAAGEYSEKLGKIFSIRPSDIVLAYYHKNSYTMMFGAGKFIK